MGTRSLSRTPDVQRARLLLFRDRLRAGMRACGLKNMEALSRASGISVATLSRYMGGDRLPSTPMLMQLSDCINTTMDWLAGYSSSEAAARIARTSELSALEYGDRLLPIDVEEDLARDDTDLAARARLQLARMYEASAEAAAEQGDGAAIEKEDGEEDEEG